MGAGHSEERNMRHDLVMVVRSEVGDVIACVTYERERGIQRFCTLFSLGENDVEWALEEYERCHATAESGVMGTLIPIGPLD